jgi:hypothetical protein
MKTMYKTGLALLTTMLLNSCSKLDINESPNNPSIDKATPESLFPSAVLSSAGRIGGDLSIIGGMWAQFWTQNSNSSQYRTVDSYNLQNSSAFISSPYTELYSGALPDYQLALQKSVAAQDWRYNLMITVMKAYTYQVLADLFDKVPYSEASQPDVFPQPKFEDGYTVYKALIGEIDAALAKDYRSTPHTRDQARVDLVFGERGNADFDVQMDRWERFANTLKLKMYLRMVNVKPAEAETGIKALYDADAGFLEESAGVTSYIAAPNLSNPFYEYNFRRLNTAGNLKASYTFISWLEGNNDPRANAYYGPGPVATIHQGDYAAGLPEYLDAVNPIISPTDPVWFFSRAEVCFMVAEAKLRYDNGSGTKEMYDRGVQAAFAQEGLTPGDLLDPGKAYAYPEAGTFDQKLEAIIVQKWASLFGSHALEAFFEQNRTGYPLISNIYSTDPAYIPGRLVYGPSGVTGPGNFPRRFLFPDVERERNSNTPPEVPLYTKVWWGK